MAAIWSPLCALPCGQACHEAIKTFFGALMTQVTPKFTPPQTLKSARIVEGMDRTPHRAFLRAMGMAESDFGKPLVGFVSQHGETTP